MIYRYVLPAYFCILALVLPACATKTIPTQPPQSPQEYLSNALDWIESHSVKIDTVDWAGIREQALVLAPDPQSTEDTYPALEFVVTQLGDSATFFIPANQAQETHIDIGFDAFYPEAVILTIVPGGPADRAGLRVGDVIIGINGARPRQFEGTPFLDFGDGIVVQISVQRAGQNQPITVTLEAIPLMPRSPWSRSMGVGSSKIGYIELPVTYGWEPYPTITHWVMRETDQTGTCGWILDLRRNIGGNIWSYIAAMGPILGEGTVGGFVYLDGTRDLWRYVDRKVFWGRNEQSESLVEGQIYILKRPTPPVALLTSHATMAAGELALITFQGRTKVRTFGEPTGGSPFLQFWTILSDGAALNVSGAFSMDRTGQTYQGSIEPDEFVTTDWTVFGTDHDPVILAARDWLLAQPDCAQK
ncbi:MAG TPA: S41 family peptidase [Anaerolineales bacterium]|nr:S41 family peptidase [Anaerolineales bacterium]